MLKYRGIHDPTANYVLERVGLLANCNLLEDIPQAHGFFSLAPAEISDVTSVPYVLTNIDFSRLLDFMAVTWISSSNDPFTWLQRPMAMPVVSIGQAPLFLSDSEAFFALARGTADPRVQTILPEKYRSIVTAQGSPSANVECAAWTPQHLLLKTQSTNQCLVTISQSFFPGWKAQIDDRPVPMLRANYAFQAVEVPSGSHAVELSFFCASFWVGVGFSFVGILLLLVYCLFTNSASPSV